MWMIKPFSAAGAFSGRRPDCRRMIPKTKQKSAIRCSPWHASLLPAGCCLCCVLALTKQPLLGVESERGFCGDCEADRCLAPSSLRHRAPGALRLIFRCKWTESAFCPFNQTIEGHGFVFAANNPKAALRPLLVRHIRHFLPPSFADLHSAATRCRSRWNCDASVDSFIAVVHALPPLTARLTRSKYPVPTSL